MVKARVGQGVGVDQKVTAERSEGKGVELVSRSSSKKLHMSRVSVILSSSSVVIELRS